MCRKIVAVLVAVFVLLFSVACGQTDPPTAEDIQRDAEWFTLTTPEGQEVPCVSYGSESEGTQDSKSWFAFTCNFNSLNTPTPADITEGTIAPG